MLKNNKGLSLIEIMIAGATMLGIGLAFTKMSINTNQSVKVSEKNLEIVSILSEIRGVLSDPDACQESFQNFDANNSNNTGALTEIKKENGTAVFQVGTQYGSSGLTISSIRLDSTDPNVAVVPNNSNGSTNLIVEFDRGRKTKSTRMIQKKIRLNINTQAGAGNVAIDTCNSYSSGESSIWTRNSTDPDTIFYNSGNVGIGTTTPSQELHVNGDLLANSYLYVSDKRFKQDIKTIKNALEGVRNLRGVTYNWKKNHCTKNRFEEKMQFGLIAQEVEKYYPELVNNNDNGYKSIKYANIIAILIEAIKEQNSIIARNEDISHTIYNDLLQQFEERESEQKIKIKDLEERMDNLAKLIKKLSIN